MSGTAVVIGQVLIELLNISMQALRAASIINKAQSEGRDISDQELADLDLQRETLMQRWKALTDAGADGNPER